MDSNTLHFWITEEKVNEIVERFIKSKDKKFQGKAIISRDTAEDVIRVLKQVKVLTCIIVYNFLIVLTQYTYVGK